MSIPPAYLSQHMMNSSRPPPPLCLCAEIGPGNEASLKPRLSVPDFVSQLWRNRNGKPGFEARLRLHVSQTQVLCCNHLKIRPLHGNEFNPLGPIAPKVALLTTYSFVASLFETKFAHELVLLLVVHECFHSL